MQVWQWKCTGHMWVTKLRRKASRFSRWQPKHCLLWHGNWRGNSIVAQTMAPDSVHKMATKALSVVAWQREGEQHCGPNHGSTGHQILSTQKTFSSCSRTISCQSRNLKIQKSTYVTLKAVKWLGLLGYRFPPPLYTPTTTFCPVWGVGDIPETAWWYVIIVATHSRGNLLLIFKLVSPHTWVLSQVGASNWWCYLTSITTYQAEQLTQSYRGKPL